MGDTGNNGDTLTMFKISNQGNINGAFADITLYEDTGIIGKYEAGIDTFICILTWVGDGWNNNSITYPISQNDTGNFFLAIVKTNITVNIGDTFQAAIPALSVKSSEENTAPVNALTNFGILTVIDTTLPNNWYVDISFGDTGYNGLSPNHPKKYIKNIISDNGIGLLTEGDTVYIANGIYAETVTIDLNSISLIGEDSNLTIIDPAGDSTQTSLFGIYADTQNNLQIKNLQIIGCYYGIYLNNSVNVIIHNNIINQCYAGIKQITDNTYINFQNSLSYNLFANCVNGLYLRNNNFYDKNISIKQNQFNKNLYGVYKENIRQNYGVGVSP